MMARSSAKTRQGFLVSLGQAPVDKPLLSALFELGHEMRVFSLQDLSRVLILPREEDDDDIQLMLLKMQLSDTISLWHIPMCQSDLCDVRLVNVNA